jgi:hypothetical protein
MSSQTASRPGKITDRISIFEQKQSPASQNVSLGGSIPSKHYPAKRTLSSKNVNVLKSQFDLSGENRKISPASENTTTNEEQPSSPPPPPPPRTLPPESPPQVPKRTSVTSSKPTKKPTVSPTSSGKSSPTDRGGGGGPTKTTPGRRSPPGSKTGLNKSAPVSSKTATPIKKKLVSTNPSPTTPIPKNSGNKKVASRTNSSPISPPQPQNNSSLEKSNNSVSEKTTATPVPTSKMTSSITQRLKKPP